MPRTRGRSCVAALLAILLYAAAAACQSNPSPAPMPSVAPSPSKSVASSTPSPTPPTMPAEARGTSAQSAKAFVRYYIGLVNHAVATGDTSDLKGASQNSCNSCTAVVTNIDTVYANGGSLSGEGWKVSAAREVPGRPAARPILRVGIRISPQDKIASRGAKVQHFRGGRQLLIFRLVRLEGGWSIEEWSRA